MLTYLGSYEPPKCDFDTVRMNLTVTSKGRQYDRLAFMYLGDTEVFRTSTAEPTKDGIVWTYIKDMSAYNALWKRPQRLIFDLGNQITDKYTGAFSVTLAAVFSHEGKTKTADMIMPISARKSKSNSPSAFIIPSDNATVLHKFPSSISRAVVSISACGQSTEEFWWSNVFSSDTETFNNTVNQLNGYSPFREIQLYIDGALAGVVWPFPIIFTGGVAPGLWRPSVGIDAFDLREPEIDISPFIPLISDQQHHSFEIRIVGLHLLENGTATPSSSVGAHWVVTGNIFVYLSDSHSLSPSTATGFSQMPHMLAAPPKVSVTRNLIKSPTGKNESLSYSVLVERILTISSSQFSFSQRLSYSNFGRLAQQGLSQTTNQSTSGTSAVTQLGANRKSDNVSFVYPLFVNTAYSTANDTGLTIDAQMKRGLSIEATGVSGISTYTLNAGPSHLHTEQWGKAYYNSSASGNSTSSGDTTDVFESNAGGKAYHRAVRAVNGSIVYDAESS